MNIADVEKLVREIGKISPVTRTDHRNAITLTIGDVGEKSEDARSFRVHLYRDQDYSLEEIELLIAAASVWSSAEQERLKANENYA